MPVTYADVWEFWLRYRDVAAAVDFITIHILPYWEDFPIPARDAAAHVDAIRKQVVAAFPGREIFLGEFGWPSAGRMREGALPSPVNQARVIHDVLALAKRENYPRQPDRGLRPALEAPARRHGRRPLGAFRRLSARSPNSPGAAAVSNHPHWRWQAAAGVDWPPWSSRPHVRRAGRRAGRRRTPRLWLRVAAIAFASGSVIGWTIANVPLESLTARRLDTLARLGGGRAAGADPRRRRGRQRGVAIPSFAARAGAQRGARPRIRSRSRSGPC